MFAKDKSNFELARDTLKELSPAELDNIIAEARRILGVWANSGTNLYEEAPGKEIA
jgi:hypothetical protein